MGGHQKLTNWRIIETDPFTTIGEVAEELYVDHSRVIQCLKQIGKVKNLNKGVYHELIKNQKNCHFEVVISSYYMQQQIISLSDYDV